MLQDEVADLRAKVLALNVELSDVKYKLGKAEGIVEGIQLAKK